MSVTPHQNEKLEELLEILEYSNRANLIGSAGVGKTYVVDELLKRLAGTKHTSKKVICAAPTHQALAVLQEKIQSKVEFQTIQSVLKYRPYTDEETGEECFKPVIDERFPPLKGVSLLLVDEGSMVDTLMLWYLEKYGKACTIIFIGDDKQINPIGEEDSPVFLGKPTEWENLYSAEDTGNIVRKVGNKFYSYDPYPYVELTEIIRQGEGNPIITLSRNLNEIWKYVPRVNSKEEGFVYTINEAKIIEELAKSNGSDAFKYVAYSNDEVDRMNILARKAIYGLYPAKIELGETIVFSKPYQEYMNNSKLKVETLNIEDIVFDVPIENNSRSGMVFSKFTLKCYIINGKKVDDWGDGVPIWKGIFVIHEESEIAFRNLTYTLSNNCRKKILDFTTRNEFLNTFAKFKYNHALTVHKSQGSTFGNVVLNITNVNGNPRQKEKTRLFYTGITRAKNLLILYYTPKK